jgi:hypothetical protein
MRQREYMRNLSKMRIKFNAWNSAEQKMYENVGVNPYAEDGYIFDQNGAIDDMYGFPPTLLRFTGLLDKNGKEVYFGHILEDPDTKGVLPHNDRWKVEEDEYNFGVSLSPIGDFCYPWRADRLKEKIAQMVIIGNIYAQPELLENKSEEAND